MLFSVVGWVSWSRPSRLAANLVSLSFPTSDPPPFIGRTLSSSFPSAFVSRNTVVSFVLVWIQFELGKLGIFVNYFVDSLG